MIDITFRARRLDNGKTLESNSVLRFNNPVSKSTVVSLFCDKVNGWIPVDPDTVELIGNPEWRKSK